MEIKTKTLRESLEIRKSFNISMDFVDVWETLYGIPLESFKGPSVWRFIAVFLLSLEGKRITAKAINDFISMELGRPDSNHFVAELFPLPKQSRNDFAAYSHVWNSVEDYRSSVLEKRVSLITRNIRMNRQVKLIICYEKIIARELISKNILPKFECVDQFPIVGGVKNRKYELHVSNLGTDRHLYIITTPFFGNGQMSYENMKDLVKILRERGVFS